MNKFGKVLEMLQKTAPEVTTAAEALQKAPKSMYGDVIVRGAPEAQDFGKVIRMGEVSPLESKSKSGLSLVPEQETPYWNDPLHKEWEKLVRRSENAGQKPISKERFMEWKKTGKMPPEETVGGPTADTQGPTTLTGSNKLHNPDLSGIVDYKKSKALTPMVAAQGLYEDLQNSALGDIATNWSKLKGMVGDKLAGQLDLSGGKDKQFQGQASDILATALDPVNLIPGLGGVAAGATEALARDEKKKKTDK